MAKNIVWVMLYLLSVSLMAQTGFMKSYDIEGTTINSSGDILVDTNGITILSVSECYSGLECTGLIKTDFNGIKQSDNVFENSDGSLSPADGMKSLGDAGFIIAGEVGHPFEGYSAAFFLRITINGDSLKLSEHGNIGQRAGGASVAPIEDSLFCLMRYGDIAGTYANLKLLKMDTCLSNLTEIPLLGIDGYSVNGVAYTLPSPDSLFLYLVIGHKNGPQSTQHRHLSIRKIDLMGNTVWTYPLNGYTTFTNTPTQIVLLPNGNIVTRWFDEVHYTGSNNFDSNPYLICISSNGQDSIWRYDFNADVYPKFPVDIKLAANGDIIGCGYTDNPNYNYACGWLFRMSPDGQLLWEREYISNIPPINFLVAVGLDEDTEGNIFVTGPIIDVANNGIGYESNAFLFKVLPNGCFTPNCNGGAEDTLIVASTVVGIKEASLQLPPKEGGLVVFPNPANDFVQVLLPHATQNATLQITDLQGRVVKTITYTTASFGGGKGEAPFVGITTHDLPNGMYLVSYIVAGKQTITTKLLIFH